MKGRILAVSLVAAVGACTLLAADFWETKKFTEWNEKEVKKMLESSPWATKVSVPIPRGGAGGGARGSGGRGGGGMSFLPQDEGGGGDMGGGGGGRSGGGGGGGRGGGGVSFSQEKDVIVRWHTALPVKQAIAISRYGKEVGTSEEAAKMLTREEQFYVVGLAGVPGRGFTPDPFKAGGARINVKNVDPIQPMEAQISQDPLGTNVFLIFPRKQEGAHVFKVEENEVEIVVDVPNLKFKKKFKLKDMIFNGKLEM